MAMGRQAVLTLGAEEEEATAIMEHLRQRDAERMDMEAAGGLFAGRSLVLGRTLARKEPQDGPAPAAS
jgi:glutathione-regulated potassium-efflux system protein KefB